MRTMWKLANCWRPRNHGSSKWLFGDSEKSRRNISIHFVKNKNQQINVPETCIILNSTDSLRPLRYLYIKPIPLFRYVKFNPNCDMLITGIRKENLISYFGIHDEKDENDETRLISCSAFMDHLMNSLSSIIDNMESSSFVNLEFYWSHILIQTNTFYNMLESSGKIQLQPKKFVRNPLRN